MRATVLKGIAVCAAIPLLVTLIGPSAYAEEPAEQTPGTTLTDRLVEAAAEGVTAPAELAEEVALPVAGGGSLTFDDAERVTATVVFESAPSEALLASVAGIAEVDTVLGAFPAATVRVAPARLGELAELPGVLSATPALRPFTGGAVASGGAASSARAGGPLAAAPRPSGEACGPIPIEADGPLHSAEARERFGVDGTGVTVGVISDSFGANALPTSWEADVAAGVLPGAGNPCGRTIPVEVISDMRTGSDEGRAMAQLVHGIAPGARILFADAGASEFEMAEHIGQLAAAGADIIVDDISWNSETTFQQGFIATAIEQVKASGVAYFTSAGNGTALGTRGASADRPISSWRTTAYRAAACPDWLLTGPRDPLANLGSYDCLDFDPDPAIETPFDTLQTGGAVGDGADAVSVVGSIAEPMFGITTSYEWRFYAVDPVTDEPKLLAIAPQIGEFFPGSIGRVSVPSGSEIRMVMVRTAFDPAAPSPAVQLQFMRGGEAFVERAHLGDGVNDVVGATTFGHAGDGSALSVAALDWRNPTVLRDYSSLGSTTLYYAPVDLTGPNPAQPLAAPITPQTPNIASVDGTQTSFFDDTGDPEYRFFGTSAAAPNAAAVAALAKSYVPGLSGGDLTAGIVNTARGPAAGGPVNPYTAFGIPDSSVFGAGIVDASALLESLTVLPGTPQGFRASEVTADSFVLSWDTASDAKQLQLEATPVAVVVADAPGETVPGAAGAAAATITAELAGDATSHKLTGLSSGTVYAVRLTAQNPVGSSDAATLEVATTSIAPKPPTTTPPTTTPPPTPSSAAPQSPLAQTGAGDTPLLALGAGAILLLGAAACGAVALRRRIVR
ncbi:fibronectin type III domain protein [Leucobacter luti]|uniref:Fibronectin type III domain protein n=1 Tax=Leucobacter luti TaxID=340320 RepID=A0A4R6RXG0_9MICO|nr:S8 family serine peptidase [Leucobacter luti]TDP90876.1 fibronectin type III domain protein [Leucobacter luti]